MTVQAQARISVESQVRVNRRYQTLFYGLKKNHPHNAAIVHPLAFLLRRVIYAVIIIFMFDRPFAGSLILMGMSLAFLCYVLCEAQWEDNLMNQQHIVNEVVLYICLVLVFILCDTVVSEYQQKIVGWLLISLIIVTVIYNVCIVAIYVAHHFKILLQRKLYRIKIARAKGERRASNKVTPMVITEQLDFEEEDLSPTKINLLGPGTLLLKPVMMPECDTINDALEEQKIT